MSQAIRKLLEAGVGGAAFDMTRPTVTREGLSPLARLKKILWSGLFLGRWWGRRLTAHWRLMPSFIIIGAMRCGTTSLYHYLTQHPLIAPTFHKGVHFFDHNFERGNTWYRAHFPLSFAPVSDRHTDHQGLITGEATPYYMLHPLAPRRTAAILPCVKLIAILRNPVDRAYSHYWHVAKAGGETLPFEEAIACEPQRLAGEREKLLQDERYRSFRYQYHSYLARGEYVDQLKAWELFPPKQMLILCSEEFYSDPVSIMRQVFRFLNVPDYEPRALPLYNQLDYPEMEPGVRNKLVDHFRPYNQRLYEYVGRDFGWNK